MAKKRKVLLIGWDAADWKFLNPLIDAGLMPTLKKLIEGGVMGRLATLDPPSLQHFGLLSLQEKDPTNMVFMDLQSQTQLEKVFARFIVPIENVKLFGIFLLNIN